MQELTLAEVSHISGGISCIDFDMWTKVQNKAQKDGIILSGIVSVIAMTVTYGGTESIRATILTGAIIAPYVAAFAYFNSSAWNIFSS